MKDDRTTAKRDCARVTPTVLLVTPEADPQKAGRFTGRPESTGEVIVANTRQPLVDGARELLARGFDPGTPLTMRHEGKTYDSFQPLPIGQWAKWSYAEGEKTPLQRQRWKPREMPIAACPEEQKSGLGPLAGAHLPAGGEIASTAAPISAASSLPGNWPEGLA
jgi:hypothetical protein